MKLVSVTKVEHTRQDIVEMAVRFLLQITVRCVWVTADGKDCNDRDDRDDKAGCMRCRLLKLLAEKKEQQS